MGFEGILVSEIFRSIQGESTHVGLPYSFVRLTGCNLRCSYCDTTYAFKGGTKMSVSEVVATVRELGVPRVLLTGGEPLLQRNTPTLARTLRNAGFEISTETHGEVSLEPMLGLTRFIMDVKTPGSGMCREGFWANLKFLGPGDEIKFVITSQSDYEWARETISSKKLPALVEILISPALSAEAQPGEFESVPPRELAEWILRDQLPVRFQLQLHKQLWGSKRGV